MAMVAVPSGRVEGIGLEVDFWSAPMLPVAGFDQSDAPVCRV
jgi:hypothetical protein